MKKILVIVFVSALALSSSLATAKEGLYLGAFIPFNDLSGDIKGVDNGNGLGFRAGYGLNKYLAIEGSVFKSKHDTSGGGNGVDFSGGTIDLKLDLPLTGSKMEPYFLIGVGGYELKGSGIDYKGGGSQFGLGLDIYLFPELNFNVGLTWRKITFDKGTPVDLHEDVTTLDIGLAYHFL
jgi:hypothetical protein